MFLEKQIICFRQVIWIPVPTFPLWLRSCKMPHEIFHLRVEIDSRYNFFKYQTFGLDRCIPVPFFQSPNDCLCYFGVIVVGRVPYWWLNLYFLHIWPMLVVQGLTRTCCIVSMFDRIGHSSCFSSLLSRRETLVSHLPECFLDLNVSWTDIPCGISFIRRASTTFPFLVSVLCSYLIENEQPCTRVMVITLRCKIVHLPFSQW
jgi:hypothetical protein